jgi:RecB family exonuclease
MPRKPRLSPTKIATYLECALKYRFIYLDRIGRFYARARAGYSFGSTLHLVLESFHAEGGTASAEEIEARYQERWISAGYETPEEEAAYRAAGTEALLVYHRSAAERLAAGIETLFTEKRLAADLGDFILEGRVDRVDRHPDGTLEVIDYKSGRTEVTQDQVAGSLAMNVYQLLLRKLYPERPVAATIVSLRSGQEASASLSEEQAVRFEADLLEIGREILSRDFTELVPVRIEACEECDFLRKCGAFWRIEERFGERLSEG